MQRHTHFGPEEYRDESPPGWSQREFRHLHSEALRGQGETCPFCGDRVIDRGPREWLHEHGYGAGHSSVQERSSSVHPDMRNPHVSSVHHGHTDGDHQGGRAAPHHGVFAFQAGRQAGVFDDDHPSDTRSVQSKRSHEPQHDLDYRQWRNEQIQRFDNDYANWRKERQQKFANEFEAWRRSRS